MAEPRCRDCGGTIWDEEGRCAELTCRAFPTLGYQVADFIEAKCVIPDRDQAGEAFMLTDEQLRFLLWLYRLRLWHGDNVFSRQRRNRRAQPTHQFDA